MRRFYQRSKIAIDHHLANSPPEPFVLFDVGRQDISQFSDLHGKKVSRSATAQMLAVRRDATPPRGNNSLVAPVASRHAVLYAKAGRQRRNDSQITSAIA